MTHCDGIETCLNTPRCQPAQRAQNSWQNGVIFDRILRGNFVNSMIMSEKSQILLVSAHGCRIFFLSRRFWHHAETKISAGASRITRPAKLNEILQYDEK